ncbi:unnamed protein product [Rotaria sordida]|uniref:Uncharacterized protein n=1 Tax=Rotaria sordida TaxID=392033 RepID=A0A819P374_9BILA|nr:unnamed protein product [Rotaria sordida]CAF1086327.1 unnamed protein product [Rotaria sordida]CAF3995825.1 unnamed protein product [Rotaria sordida]CAF4007907.1 unnamed protein product [Rotaria sordida]
MNPVTIAYHFFKKVQQKYNLKEENLLTDAENEKVNQLISFFQEIISSYNLIIETEHTLDLSEDENTSEDEDDNTFEGEDDNTSESEDYKASESEDDFEECKHSDKSEVSRVRKYIAKGGTDFQKYELIKDFVWQKFQLARSKYLSVKDEDLKR